MASLKKSEKKDDESAAQPLGPFQPNSPDRAQIAVEPGQGFLDGFVSGRDVVSFVQFQLLVLGWSSQKVEHRFC
jgi:hypothetical protein